MTEAHHGDAAREPTTADDAAETESGSHEAGSLPRRPGRLPTSGSSPLDTAHGIEHYELAQDHPPAKKVIVTCVDYSPDQVHVQKVTDIPGFIEVHRPAWTVVRWIDIEGLDDLDVIRMFAEKYELHPLAIEDMLHIPQRPKVEDYPSSGEHHARLFVVARMLQLCDQRLESQQISFFLGRNTLLTFQQAQRDVWDPIRQRIQNSGSRLRLNDVSFLLYALLDAIVDQCFPILEHYSERLEDLEDAVLAAPGYETIRQIHAVKRELLLLRRAAWPMREAIHNLQRELHECMSENTQTYLRDVYDHSVQIIDLIETYREFASGLTETYMSANSQRMNEIMKVLTIMGTIFIPLSFLAGVYGMNMPIPENQSLWAYPIFWLVCIVSTLGMLAWFKRRGWL